MPLFPNIGGVQPRRLMRQPDGRILRKDDGNLAVDSFCCCDEYEPPCDCPLYLCDDPKPGITRIVSATGDIDTIVFNGSDYGAANSGDPSDCYNDPPSMGWETGDLWETGWEFDFCEETLTAQINASITCLNGVYTAHIEMRVLQGLCEIAYGAADTVLIVHSDCEEECFSASADGFLTLTYVDLSAEDLEVSCGMAEGSLISCFVQNGTLTSGHVIFEIAQEDCPPP